MILYVNVCVRKDSRTKLLADYLLSKFDDEITEVCLSDKEFPKIDDEIIKYDNNQYGYFITHDIYEE